MSGTREPREASPERLLAEMRKLDANTPVAVALQVALVQVRTDDMEVKVDRTMEWSQRMGYTIRKLLDDLLAMGDELPPAGRELVTDGRDVIGGLIVELREIIEGDGPPPEAPE